MRPCTTDGTTTQDLFAILSSMFEVSNMTIDLLQLILFLRSLTIMGIIPALFLRFAHDLKKKLGRT